MVAAPQRNSKVMFLSQNGRKRQEPRRVMQEPRDRKARDERIRAQDSIAMLPSALLKTPSK